MKQITELKEQVKNKKRVSVYLDGEFYCGLDLITVMKYRLKKGDFIEESELVKIQYEAELQACFDRALTFISSAIKTKKQIKDKLKSLGYLDEIIEKAVLKLEDYGFVNDKDYASRYASTYKTNKGKKLIRLELIKKGVSASDLEDVLNGIESQQESCDLIAEKYLKNKQIDDKVLAKLYNRLLSKGFDYEEIKSTISKYKNDD